MFFLYVELLFKMPRIDATKENKAFGQNIIVCHGRFNNSCHYRGQLPTKKYLERLPSLFDIDLFSLNLEPQCVYFYLE